MAIRMSLLRSCAGIWTRMANKDVATTELQTTLYQIPRAFSDRTLDVTEMVRRCA
jgi:hypothetical protein